MCKDATGLSRGFSRLQLNRIKPVSPDATGLPRGVSRLRLNRIKPVSPDATGLPRGVSRLRLHSWERESPRPKAVASSFTVCTINVATCVRLHGASPWHLPCAKPLEFRNYTDLQDLCDNN